MRRMILALFLLALLFGASFWNSHYMGAKAEQLIDIIDKSSSYANRGDYAGAAAGLESAIDIWKDMERYTHMFVNHGEISGTTDAFYDYLSDLCEENGSGAVGSYQKLRARIREIAASESLSPGSIF